MPEETIIWEGKPDYKARAAVIEILGGGWSILGVLLVVPFMSVLFYSVFCFITGNLINGIISSLVFLGIIFVPEILKNIRRKNTRYTVTNKKVIIDLWWWGKKSRHEVPLEEIDKFYSVEFRDRSGEIHLISKKAFNFKTRSFWSGLSRPTVSFEDIPNVVDVTKKLNEVFKD